MKLAKPLNRKEIETEAEHLGPWNEQEEGNPNYPGTWFHPHRLLATIIKLKEAAEGRHTRDCSFRMWESHSGGYQYNPNIPCSCPDIFAIVLSLWGK